MVFAFKVFFSNCGLHDWHNSNGFSFNLHFRRTKCSVYQSYRLEELMNKLLTKWNLLQTFLIHFTLYLYLWWSLYQWWKVSRLIYLFPKVSSLDEKSLGKIILTSFRKVYKKVLSLETYISVGCVCYMYIFFILYWAFLI